MSKKEEVEQPVVETVEQVDVIIYLCKAFFNRVFRAIYSYHTSNKQGTNHDNICLCVVCHKTKSCKAK